MVGDRTTTSSWEIPPTITRDNNRGNSSKISHIDPTAAKIATTKVRSHVAVCGGPTKEHALMQRIKLQAPTLRWLLFHKPLAEVVAS